MATLRENCQLGDEGESLRHGGRRGPTTSRRQRYDSWRRRTAKLAAQLVGGRTRAVSLVLWTAFRRGRLGAPAPTAVCCRFWAESRIPCCIARCRHRRGHGTLLSGHGHRDLSAAIQALPADTPGDSRASTARRHWTRCGCGHLAAAATLVSPTVSCSLRPHRSVCGDWTPSPSPASCSKAGTHQSARAIVGNCSSTAQFCTLP
jgi:hypothetical protein